MVINKEGKKSPKGKDGPCDDKLEHYTLLS